MVAGAVLVVALMIAANALYVAAEFATVSSRRSRIAELADGGDATAGVLLPILEDRDLLDRYIAGCQVGITLSSLLIGYYGQGRLTPIVAPALARLGLPEAAAATVSVVGLLLLFTFLQVILGEIVPKSIALRFPERTALLVVHPMRWSLTVLRPLIALLNGSAHAILRRVGRTGVEESHVHHPDELEVIFEESAAGGLIDAGERDMLGRVFHLNQRIARQIMVPRTRMVAVPMDARPRDVIADLIASTHTRFPVYEDSVDRIRGVVHLRDLYAACRADTHEGLEGILRPIPIVPETLSVTELWARMRRERVTMAAIFDEYGGVVGIVTVEDVIEELFGELQDEFDREEDLIRKDADGRITVRGDMLVSDINERFLLALPEGPADTLGGLIMDQLERVAREGDEIVAGGVRLRVTEVAGQAVEQVRMTAENGDAPGGDDEGAAHG